MNIIMQILIIKLFTFLRVEDDKKYKINGFMSKVN
jgi:hypothetical protein